MTKYQQNVDRALELAAVYSAMCRAGRFDEPLHHEIRAKIYQLVGRVRSYGDRPVLPRVVRRAMI
jgi:hypothetical protein